MPTRWTRNLILIGLLATLLVFGPGLVSFYAQLYTDWLWFEDLGYLSVYQTRLLASVVAFLAGGLVAAAVLAVNWLLFPALLAASPVIRPFRPRGRMDSRPLRGLLIGAGLVIAFVMAGILSARWMDFLLFLHAVPFGLADPIFGLDVGFYLFRLPVYDLVAGWFLALILLSIGGALAAYGTAGTLRDRGPIAHLSGLGALALALIAAQYQLACFRLLISTRGVVFGAGYTDIHGRIPLYNLLSVVVLVAAVLFLLNLFLRRWRLLAIVGAAWLFIAVVGPVYPAVLQRYVVAPNELAAERPYIQHAIRFTRIGFGLENVREQDFPAEGTLTPEVLEANQATIQNIRLWDWRPLLTTYGQLQEIRLYYTFNDVDVDRYVLSGGLRQGMLAVRELDVDQLADQAQTWVNRHLVFTHGYGAAVSPVNEFTREGLPVLLVRDIPPQSSEPALQITRPEIYFGEVTKEYALVNTTEAEFDYPSGDENIYTRYEGPAGVPLGGFFRRALFAIRFGSSQILFSAALRPDSRVLFHRQIGDRVWTLAPIFWYDPDPYPVIADGRIVWLRDAYTWSDRFPYSEPFNGVNYIRNSVKVAIDAYTGETTFYVVDPTDPVIRTYQAIFPDLFTPGEQMPAVLREHWRYPEQLFRVQSAAYAAYHMDDPQVFYNKEDLWATPTEVREQGETTEMAPYYVVMKLPGEDEMEFLLMRPYVPNGRSNMIAWLYADSDGEDYGQLGVYKFPKEKLIYGPMQIEARFDQDPYISQQLTLWDQRGSQVIRGNLLVIPMDDTLLYVEPLFLQAETGRFPELKRVLVAYGDSVAMGEDLPSALAQVVGLAAPPGTSPETSPGTPPAASADVAALARSAQAHYLAAQECLRRGDWACYGRELEALGTTLEALVAATASPE